MFHLIESTPLTLIKSYSSKFIFLLPLNSNQLIAISDDNTVFLYQLSTMQIINYLKLPASPKKAIISFKDTLILLMPQLKQLVQVHFNGRAKIRIETIYKFPGINHNLIVSNPHRQKEYYSTMTLESFLLSDTFYIKQQISQRQKSYLKIFVRQESAWKTSIKDLSVNNNKIQKMNQQNQLVLYQPNPQDQGIFKFTVLNSHTLEEEEIILQSQSFRQYSTVFAIKSYKDNIFLQINHKPPELVCFTNQMENRSVNVGTSIIWVVSLGPFIFSLGFSLKNPLKSRLQLKNQTDTVDQVQGQFQNIKISKSGLVLDFQKERTQTHLIQVMTHRPVSKCTLYINLLNKAFKQAKSQTGFFNEVIDLLDL